MKRYKLLNNVLGWAVFVIAAVTYILTLESTASFWDCGEFIASGYKLEVGHPPGNPIFMLTARFFANFASSPSEVAYMVNLMSGLLSAATILLLFWTITRLAQKIVLRDGETEETMSLGQMIAILGCGLVGALAYAWSDTFWFSAVEGEVYAYSSFCTALVFWLILKWESVADLPHANRYIILIAYIIGVSIAVHLLNLLCIPAIVLVYYYRKYKNTDLKGSLIALLVSFVLIVLLLYGLVPGFVEVAGWVELLFVNVFHLPFNSGVVFYFFLIVGVIAWAIYETYAQRSDKLIKISFLISIVLVGIPFIGDGYIIGIILTAVLAYYLFTRKKLAVVAMNTILLSLFVIFIGYSSYALIVIRSTANTPMDQNSPEDIFSLGGYLNREQYGDRPLFYGQTFPAEIARDANGTAISTKGKAIWKKKLKTSENESDRYIVTGYNEHYEYQPELNMLFPRMYSDKSEHISAYKEWTNFKGRPVQVRTSEGTKTVMKPTFAENLAFFLDYQLNYMYWRYFMWNFAGRQNDIQGHGEVQNGNWISGFNFIDKHIAGDQTNLPDDLKNNAGRNVFYMLPLLLGLIGLFYQAFSGKKGIESFWVTFFLFFMTGIAIVIYLNQTPYQPRERDYAYAGSFYAFAIWIGLGVAAVWRGLNYLLKTTDEKPVSAITAAVAALLCLCVPLQMVSQTWDDHDRSGRYVCRDFGMNYLSSVDENGIIFTNGDNDTFPLWYVQEVEGYRTDVRVCNLSYLQTDWYIDQMKRPAYESAPLPISADESKYAYDVRSYNYVINRLADSITVSDGLDYLYSDEDWTKDVPGYGKLNHLPTNKLYIPVNADAAVASGTVAPELKDSIVSRIVPDFTNKRGFTMSEIASLDIINTNAMQGWKRPVYFAVTVGSSYYLGLEDYFSRTGLAYQVVPLKGVSNNIDTDKMYDNMVNKFRWGGIDKATPEHPLYLDENVRRMCNTHRMMFGDLVVQLIAEGKTDKALTALDLIMEKIPGWQVTHDLTSVSLAQSYLDLGEKTKGEALLTEILDNSAGYLNWYKDLTSGQLRSVGNDYQKHLYIVHTIHEMSVSYGLPELQKKIEDRFAIQDPILSRY
ncbi:MULTISPECIES: DUF2723 domain-containing protein [Barnesiella]|uniref:glycosyltransferase family 117 protein n=1 Tax=Barnesiella TaxID=397864 RepID=UPI00202F3798|nr:DUF2723 domain-containing protein [Barnesiella sp. B2-R-119]MCM0688880.1 DUF2723 domain-containing protein [Barnesiella sp. B2-R-119]